MAYKGSHQFYNGIQGIYSFFTGGHRFGFLEEPFDPQDKTIFVVASSMLRYWEKDAVHNNLSVVGVAASLFAWPPVTESPN